MTEVVEVVNEVGDVVVSHIASMSSVETRLVAATSPRRKNPPRDEIEEGGEEEQQVPEESEAEKYMAAAKEEMEMGKVEMGKDEMEMGKEEEVTTMSYTELELATPHQEEAPALEMMYETTLKPQVTFSLVDIRFIFGKIKINHIHCKINSVLSNTTYVFLLPLSSQKI